MERGKPATGVEPVDRLHEIEGGTQDRLVGLSGDQTRMRHIAAGQGTEHPGLPTHRFIAVGALVLGRST